MSRKSEILVNPNNGVKVQTWVGFSWPCLFLGIFWFLYKRLYGWAAIAFLAAISTAGFSWLVFPFFSNSAHRNNLEKSGWLTEAQAVELLVSPETHVRCPDCRELVRMEARVCKHCQAKLVPQN